MPSILARLGVNCLSMMRGPTPDRTQYSVACGCGGKLTLDARGFGKPRTCPACKAPVTVAWGRDPKTRKTVPVAVMKVPPSKPAPPGSMVVRRSEKPKPSAPLVPLHLRAPVRHRLKPGTPFIECPCGERLVLRSGSLGRSIQCPACDRFHLLEIEPGAAAAPSTPPPGADAASAPSAPAAPPRALKLGEFLCKCGEVQPPRTSRTGKTFECKACGRKGHVDASPDPKTGLPVMKAVITSEPDSAKLASTPGWTCPCGKSLPAVAVLDKTLLACPACGRAVRAEPSREPVQGRTLIRPVFEEPPAAAEEARFEPEPDGAVAFEELPPLEDAPRVAADATTAACPCGADLLLTPDLAGQTIQCPACSELLAVEAEGGALRVRPEDGGTSDPGEWRLEEFA
jgi:hypothetical protein